jgi:hypothetical protein
MESEWSWPNDVVSHNDTLYVADYGNNRIRIISSDGIVTSIGNGKETSVDGLIGDGLVSFKCPFDLCVFRECLYVSDQLSHCIRKVNLNKGSVSTLTGKSKDPGYKDGSFDDAIFHYPKGLDVTSNGEIIVADYANHVIRLLCLTSKTVRTLVWGEKSNSNPNPGPTAVQVADPTSEAPADQVGKESKNIPEPGHFVLGTPASFVTPAEPYFLSISPFGDLHWNPTAPYLHTIVELFPPLMEGSIRSSRTHFSSLLHTPSLCDLSLTFEHPITPTILSRRGFLSSHYPPAAGLSYSESTSSQTIYLQSELLNCLHASVGQNKTLLDGLAKCKVPGRIVDFFGMIFDFHFMNNEIFTAIAVYILDLAGLKPEDSPLLKWALAAFSSSISFIKDIPSLLETLEDVCLNLDANEALIARVLHQSKKADVVVFLLEKVNESSALSSSIKERIHFIYKHIVQEEGVSLYSSKEFTVPVDAISQGLIQLASRLNFHSTSTLPSLGTTPNDTQKEGGYDPTFRIAIEGRPEHLVVHDWILLLKWPYFANLMASGLSESVEKKIEMPADFPPSVLLAAFQFMYCRRVLTPLAEIDDIAYLISNGAQFGFVQMDGLQAPGFEHFTNACSVNLLSPLNTTNCIDQLSIRIRIGNPEWLESALHFIGHNLSKIVKSDTERAAIMSFPLPVWSAIFDHSLRACYK